MAYRIAPEESIAEAFARIAREQLAAAGASLVRDAQSDPADAVHTARKSAKKTRSLLRLTRGSVDRHERREVNAALRDAAGRLSGARDADVLIETLDALAARYAGQLPHHHFTALRDRLRMGRPAGGAAAADPDHMRAATEFAAAAERIARWRLDGDGWRAVQPGLDRGYRRGKAAFARSRREPTVEHLHEWRKRVKDLWYHLRLVAPVCGEAVRGHAKDAHALADLLGDDHDLAVLREALVGVAGGVAADVGAVLGLVDRRRAELQNEAHILGERVYAERPKAFERRLRACWHAGCARHHEALASDPSELAQLTRAASPS